MHIYKKVLPAAVAMALAACGGGSDTVPDQSEGATYLGTHPRFDPITSDLPLNTDLIFAAAATSDGTANVGVPENAIEAAVNKLDGFSVSAYFDIAFEGSIDAASLCTPVQAAMGAGCAPNIFLVPLDTSGGDGDALNPDNIVGINASLMATTAFTASVESVGGGSNNTLRITPVAPLQAKTKYLVFLTEGLMDTSGDQVGGSASYRIMGANEPALPATLAPVRAAVQGWETIAAGVLMGAGLHTDMDEAKDSVVISYTFTTTDPLAPLVAMAAPRAAIYQSQVDAGADPSAAAANAAALEPVLSTPKARTVAVNAATGIDFGTLTQGALAADVGTLYTGAIDLPYYQKAPASAADLSYLQTDWSADQVLGSQLGNGIPPMDVDGTYNVTYRYPFAAKTGDETVPLQVTLPNPAATPAELGGASCAQVRDNTGYPTVIYVHGITSDRTSVMALGHTLASKCIATVAIDLPVHGVPANSAFAAALNVENSQLIPFQTLYGDGLHERHFNVAQDASGNPAAMNFANPTALDGSGAWFINLADLTNTRDNLRQSVMDLLNLNASLEAISALDIDGNGSLNTDNVTVVGVSLGSIVGSVFSTVNQIAMSNDASFGSNLNPVVGFVGSAGGSQLAHLLNTSPTFGPRIQAGLAANGVESTSEDYQRFLYVAQSTMASGDPVNFASTLDSLNVPVLLQQINGDTVVPNGDPALPLMGTEGLASLAGANQLGAGAANVTSTPGIVKMTAGGHASLLTPSGGAPQVTAELQAQVVSFVLSNGAQVAVGSQAAADVEAPAP